ncbi:hypothetical protein [uncultured Flavobacterium sp.]|uniref:hypothetical protein n=1 Tax=uncultured Flavobacterium sp. TaxID=165435 RepID=UPI0030CA1C9B
MFIKSLLRLHSHRRFEYKPRFFDAQKEERDKRIEEKRILRDTDKRISFRTGWHAESTMHSSRSSSFRIAIIAGVLVLACFAFLRYINIDLF